MKKHLIVLRALFLMVPTCFVGVSEQSNQEKPHSMDDVPGIQWVKYFGRPDNFDEENNVKQTSDEGYIFVGTTQSYTADADW